MAGLCRAGSDESAGDRKMNCTSTGLDFQAASQGLSFQKFRDVESESIESVWSSM